MSKLTGTRHIQTLPSRDRYRRCRSAGVMASTDGGSYAPRWSGKAPGRERGWVVYIYMCRMGATVKCRNRAEQSHG